MARLVLTSDNGEQQDVAIESDETTIGRSSANDVVIDDPAASSRHCVLERRDNRYVLRDLGSTNGTFVNGEPVSEANLGNGDIFNVGAMTVMLAGDEIEAPTVNTRPPTVALAPVAGRPPQFGKRRSRSGLWVTVGILIGVGLAVLLWIFIKGLFG